MSKGASGRLDGCEAAQFAECAVSGLRLGSGIIRPAVTMLGTLDATTCEAVWHVFESSHVIQQRRENVSQRSADIQVHLVSSLCAWRSLSVLTEPPKE
jgi:hypothetical protein